MGTVGMRLADLEHATERDRLERWARVAPDPAGQDRFAGVQVDGGPPHRVGENEPIGARVDRGLGDICDVLGVG